VPEGISAEEAVFLPGVETAASLVMDGAPLLGEDVVVIGQGVVGLLTTSLLNRMPLGSLTALERFPLRRRLSEEMGAKCLDPSSGTTPSGVDLSFELSGNPAALDTALRITGFEGRVVLGSWYGNKPASVNLGEEFHRKRLRIIGSQVSSLAPSLSGRWDKGRRIRLAWDMLRRVQPSRLVSHRIDVSEAEEAYALLDGSSENAVQVLLDYGGE